MNARNVQDVIDRYSKVVMLKRYKKSGAAIEHTFSGDPSQKVYYFNVLQCLRPEALFT